jgi:hypothetical protein
VPSTDGGGVEACVVVDDGDGEIVRGTVAIVRSVRRASDALWPLSLPQPAMRTTATSEAEAQVLIPRTFGSRYSQPMPS